MAVGPGSPRLYRLNSSRRPRLSACCPRDTGQRGCPWRMSAHCPRSCRRDFRPARAVTAAAASSAGLTEDLAALSAGLTEDLAALSAGLTEDLAALSAGLTEDPAVALNTGPTEGLTVGLSAGPTERAAARPRGGRLGVLRIGVLTVANGVPLRPGTAAVTTVGVPVGVAAVGVASRRIATAGIVASRIPASRIPEI